MTLLKIVSEFRKGVLGRHQSRNRCWMVCAPLQAYLAIIGHETELTEGQVRGNHHYWLTLPNGDIIDPTADQFAGYAGDPMPKVYFGKRPKWYRAAKKSNWQPSITGI